MNEQSSAQTNFLRPVLWALLVLLGSGTLFILSNVNYLLYHAIVELFTVGVAVSVFTIGFNTRRIASNNPLFLISVVYASVATLDLMHTLAYTGMGIFPERGADLPTQLWMAARFLESGSLLMVGLLISKGKVLSERLVLAGYATLTAVLILLIIPLDTFPAMYVPGRGLTLTKVVGEYIICALMGLAIFAFWQGREYFSSHNLKLLLAAFTATIASELSFTLYTDVYGIFNFLGHLLKLASYIFIYKALVSGFLRQPYQGLYRELAQSHDKLNKLVQLNADGLMVVDHQGVILFINPAAAGMFGRSERELIGEHFGYPLIPGDSTEIEVITENQGVIVAELRTSETEWEGQAALLTSFRDITERKKAEEELRHMSFHDSLTGLYNRNFFEESMTRLQDGRHMPLGILTCDLDGLKFINDTLGHQSGDELLIHTAELLRNTFRSSDVMARIGGDEFAVLVPETDQKTIEKLSQRLRTSVQEYNTHNPRLPLSISIGFAVSNQSSLNMQSLFREADDRMYREKIHQEGSARSAIVQALTGTMGARDFDTQGHCERLQELAAALARSAEMSANETNDLFLLSRFHDLGKVGIPDRILFKPGPLTEEEWEEMRKHSEIGYRIAQSVPDLKPIADWILKHHEKWNGTGYPQGLQDVEIPLPCRILAIVDAYDAMISDRPYRKAMSQEDAVQELRRCAGTQFDPDLVEKFILVLKERTEGDC
ncbi:MAG: MASE3 domain-containing protein [Thermodesulfobacteriota bacterium]